MKASLKTEYLTHLYYGDYVSIYSASEDLHQLELNHFAAKRNPSAYARKTEAEKAELKTRMYAFPNKHGSPVGFNVAN